MRSWPRPEIPSLPTDRGVVHVLDSRSGLRTAVAADQPSARVYACGITPYDATHLGHAFTYLGVDLLNRALLDTGHELSYVQNVTDVDDPLLERAEATGADWRELAEQQTELFRTDMTALRVIPPEPYLGVVESLDVIVDFLLRLQRAGRVYQLDDPEYPDWYCDTTGAELAGLTLPEALATFAERGGDPDRAGKRNPLDCLVWRQARPGEPAWESPFGLGRPGWHIECTAIAVSTLGAAFDVQAGGSDLAFPHHPMCAAEATAVTGQPFAQSFLHAGMVGFDGEKMSKSRGNLVFVSSLLAEGFDPMAIRLALLAHHYREDWEFGYPELDAAQRRLDRWRTALAAPAGPDAAVLLAAVRAALRDDLDAPRALLAMDDWAAAAGAGDPSAPAQVTAILDALLGVRPDDRGPAQR
ncbi:MAG: cysteine--1-D-myo-inosityl 2-amino-2-deoxy-alpha-D-glucopyranoside ligase [Propionicimonas sp.]